MQKGKKTFILTLLCLLAFGLFTACKSNEFIVTYKDGSEIIETINVKSGELATNKLITNEVHDFIGWADKEGALFDFNTPINSDITLYAKKEKLDINDSLILHYTFDGDSVD